MENVEIENFASFMKVNLLEVLMSIAKCLEWAEDKKFFKEQLNYHFKEYAKYK